MKNDKLYTISEVAEKLNLSTKTLRRWEADGKFQASRTIGGQRRYTLEDLQILDAIKHGTIPSKSDLLTLQQAANLFGVTPQTIIRWENEGKIHPFITSGNTYYPKSRLVEKIGHLKQVSNDHISTNSPDQKLPHRPVPSLNQTYHPETVHPPAQTEQNVENQTSQGKTNNLTSPSPSKPLDFKTLSLIITINFLLNLSLFLGYHLLFSKNQVTSTPTSPSASTPTQTPLQKTLQAIFSLTGDLETPGSITTKNNLTVGKALTLLPTTPPLKPTPGTLYFDASTQTLKLFTHNHWVDFPNPKLLLPQSTQLASGQAILPQHKTQTTITQTNITPNSNIIVTFTSDYSPARKYWLTRQTGQFTLHTDFPPAKNATFTYLILTPTSSLPSTPTPTASTSAQPHI